MKPDVFVAIVAITHGVDAEVTDKAIIVTGKQDALDELTTKAAPVKREPGRDTYVIRGA